MLNFQKLHGLGNDFIFLDQINPIDYDLQKLAVQLCNRQTGIGADGIILVLPSDKADIKMRIINSDGSEPNMCGNGIRCFAKYVFEHQLITKKTFSIETPAGIIIPELTTELGKVVLVRVNMGSPKLNRKDIPMIGADSNVVNESLVIHNTTYFITSMLMTIPHTIVFADRIDETVVISIGKQIEKHPTFPEGTNVNFVEVINDNEIKVRTWERGAGATLACGTGACASAVASILNGKTKSKVLVHLLLGDLTIEWINDTVFMTGPAINVFSGQINI
jgi:diaminopimelate epimerase